MREDYQAFLASKTVRAPRRGLTSVPVLAEHLFNYQAHSVAFALEAGGSGLFLDCVAGETLIDGPDGPRRIDALAKDGRPIRVYSGDARGRVVVAIATAPFKKGRARLYAIKTASGREISATAGHRFLTAAGWRAVSELRPGSLLLVSARDLRASISERALSALRQGDRSFERTHEGSTGRCLLADRRYGQQLLLAEDIDLVRAPSQADVRGPGPIWSRAGDRAHRSEYSRRSPDTCRPSTQGSNDLDYCVAGAPKFQLLSSGSELFERSIRSVPLAASSATPALSIAGLPPSASQLIAGAPCSDLRLDTVVSIKYLRTDDYYDLHVPGYENYFAHGICSHNTGLGKTECQLEFLRHAAEATNGRALLLTPLAVAGQTKRRADRWGYEARVIRDQSEAGEGINIINYDRLDRIDPAAYGAVALDEASILKSFTGKTTRALIEAFKGHRFKMAATATPAPNDHMEIGQYSEFLEIMPSNEMLMRWFITDQTQMGRYRIKGHAERNFWDWLASWSRMAELPSDLGGDDTGFILPPVAVHRHRARETNINTVGLDLFASMQLSATNLHDVKRQTSAARADLVADLVAAEPAESWLIWCDTDYEADALKAAIPTAIEVRGSHSIEQKEERLEAFATGQARHLIAKPQMCGFGLDWSHCARMAFVGRSYSYETFYQAVRRCQRFGQTRQVQVHIAVAEGEAEIGRVIDRKAGDHTKMRDAMRSAMRRTRIASVQTRVSYNPNHKGRTPEWLVSAA